MTFAEYLYKQKLDPFTIAFESEDNLKKLKAKWEKENGNIIENNNTDVVFDKLSKLNLKIDNNKLVAIVEKMTKDDKSQTKLVGSWIYYCLKNDASNALKYKGKVSDKYQHTIEKYIDSFISMLKK